MDLPNNDTGDALRRLTAKGDDLTRPRNIDFSVVFDEQSAANAFAERIREKGFQVSVDNTESASFSWDVTVVNCMKAEYQEITDFEALLQNTAESLGGHNDGWGCFTQNP